jgi:hypothetical protein
MDEKLLNLIFALVTGRVSTPGKTWKKFDIWDYEEGVRFFTSIYIREARMQCHYMVDAQD